MLTPDQVDRVRDDLKRIAIVAGDFGTLQGCVKAACNDPHISDCMERKIFLMTNLCRDLDKDIQGMMEGNQQKEG